MWGAGIQALREIYRIRTTVLVTALVLLNGYFHSVSLTLELVILFNKKEECPTKLPNLFQHMHSPSLQTHPSGVARMSKY